MEKHLGKEYTEGDARQAFLKYNCDLVESKGYMKPFTPEELVEMKETLAETSIEINDVEIEKKKVLEDFKLRTKPLLQRKSTLLQNIKHKAEFVDEMCFKFIDAATKEVGFYNANGDLIESRPAFGNELQTTVFQIQRTGTGN